MTTSLKGPSARLNVLGSGLVSKATGTLAASTVDLFTITGGLVLITALVGKATVSITVANSYKLTMVPTAGDTTDICTATDIGTTDTVAGTTLGFAMDAAEAVAGGDRPFMLKGGQAFRDLVAPVGKIKSVSAGTDGNITWYATWVPLEDNARLVAA